MSKTSGHGVVLAVVTALSCAIPLVSSVAHGQIAPKAPEPATLKANADMAKTLPFADRQDFDDAMRGFIGTMPDALVPGTGPRPVWNMKPYEFLKQNEAADSVNPSLWRQAQLNAIHGLFKVTERVYQVRGFDISNMTIVEGDTALIVIDTLSTAETARAALELYYQHRPNKPVGTVIYTHSHADHFGGVKGVTSEADVAAGKVQVLAPAGFMEAVAGEIVMAGTAMSRRAQYQFGGFLPPGPRGHVDTGLGKAVGRGRSTLIAPTATIDKNMDKRVIDGVEIVFQLAPGSEAPAEMLIYFPQFRVLDMAEDVTHTMHNLYTMRGAEVRDGNLWSRYIGEALETFGDKTDIVIAQHHWPVAGQARVVDAAEEAPRLYKFINDQSLRLLNQGYTPAEIAETLHMPASLEQEWSARGYYGTLQPQRQGGLPEVSRLVRRQSGRPQSAAAGRERAQDGRIHGRRRRGDRARARRLREGRIPLGGERDEPGGVRRSRQPRRARARRRCAGAARLPGRGGHLAQRLSGRRDGAAQRRAQGRRRRHRQRRYAEGAHNELFFDYLGVRLNATRPRARRW